jgi:L-ascorbate metabolism protein UlaG (beta-lactamase superfamily)
MDRFANHLQFTWLGHATFLFDTPGGRRVIVDPWIRTNPSTPDSARRPGHLDLMLVTHGHEDHTADAVAVARESGAEVVAPYELALWLRQKGLRRVTGMNLGGTLAVLGLSVTMVPALHSSSIEEEGRSINLGSAAGYVIGFEDGTTIYFAGDTAVFGDMRLIAELYRPAVAFLPIGDLYTMGPEQAAKACELLAIRYVVPMHYGTFPALTGTPARLRELVEPRGVRLLEPAAGEPTSLSTL